MRPQRHATALHQAIPAAHLGLLGRLVQRLPQGLLLAAVTHNLQQAGAGGSAA